MAGAYKNDSYRTSGGTPAANAFKKAREVLSTAPHTAPDGQIYHQAVIYIGDGMANYFLDSGVNNADDVCPDVNPVSLRWVTVRCQTGVTASGKLRPITAMIDQANQLKQENPYTTIYAIGMAGVNPTGISEVASSPDDFFTANDSQTLKSTLFQIKGLEGKHCIEAGASGSGYVDSIQPQHYAELLPPYDTPAGVYGYMYLYDANGQPLPPEQHKVPVVQEMIGGSSRLTWSLPPEHGLAPGNYIATAWIGYKGDDGVSRVYDTFLDPTTKIYVKSMPFVVRPSSTEVVVDRFYLDLDPAAGVCSAP
jgi:hypothetical protein